MASLGKAEYNSDEKEKSRKFIADIVKSKLKNQPIKMLELLGGGVGLNFYAKELPIIDKIQAIECFPKAFHNFQLSKDKPSINFVAEKSTILKHFKKNYNTDYNFINLDFCGTLYKAIKYGDISEKYGTYNDVARVLKANRCPEGGILSLTFLIGKTTAIRALKKNPNAITDKDEIVTSICNIAKENKYNEFKHIDSYAYHSTNKSLMCNFLFEMKRA